MGDDDNAASRPSGGRAAGWMIYGACPGAGRGSRPGAVTSLADGPNLGWVADVAGRC
jgi:hypothetical protein